jgi:hypothetical protein
LIDALWESIEADVLPLTDAQRAELDHRLSLRARPVRRDPVGASQGGLVQEELRHPVLWTAEARADLARSAGLVRAPARGFGRRVCHRHQRDSRVNRRQPAPISHPVQTPPPRRSTAIPVRHILPERTERIVVIACYHDRRDPRRWQVR